jgi:hypothetical protein
MGGPRFEPPRGGISGVIEGVLMEEQPKPPEEPHPDQPGGDSPPEDPGGNTDGSGSFPPRSELENGGEAG